MSYYAEIFCSAVRVEQIIVLLGSAINFVY